MSFCPFVIRSKKSTEKRKDTKRYSKKISKNFEVITNYPVATRRKKCKKHQKNSTEPRDNHSRKKRKKSVYPQPLLDINSNNTNQNISNLKQHNSLSTRYFLRMKRNIRAFLKKIYLTNKLGHNDTLC